ncbi:MAG: glycoside hydrolase family 20 zincin-like fold domain-containing protein [Pyrinomonadaceae bacterium]
MQHLSIKNISTKNISRRLTLLLCLLTLAACNALAQQQRSGSNASIAANTPQLIPQPKQLELLRGGDDFALSRGTPVVLADPRSEDDLFAAQDFINDVKETANVALSVGRRRGARRAVLIGLTDNSEIRAALARSGASVPQSLNDEGYVLDVGANEIVVAGRTAAGVFYGLQTLKQLVRGDGATAHVPGVRIVDWPSMRWRAVSDDISRGPVPTVAYIKKQIRTFAAFKINMHSFYMEHTFASRAHPLIAPEDGALTPAEIRELVAYAHRYHVELVPEQQTFGHLHKALKFEKYNELAETPYGDVLSPQQAGSYALVGDLYRELNDLFPGKFFHIGADETFELGEGQSREAVKQRGVGSVYFEHLRRVHDLLQPYNRRLMMWGDIALNHPDLIGNIPRDMIVMNWTYGARDSYAPRIEPFRKAGLDQFVCPGVQNWNQIFPNTDTAIVNIRNFARDGQAAHVLGLMNTSWDDDGESLFEMTWYGIALGAAASWQDAPLDAESFDRNFDWAFFRHDGDQFVKAIRALGSVNATLGINSSDQLFWQGPFTSAFQERARSLDEKTPKMRLAVERAEEGLLREQAGARRNRESLAALRFAAERFDHLGRRMEVAEQFSRDYWNAYLNMGNRRQVLRLRNRYAGAIYNRLREMSEELAALREGYRTQWLRENRPYWLQSILARYDLMINVWLTKSRALDDALREYEDTSTLPTPEDFGLGARPADTIENKSAP